METLAAYRAQTLGQIEYQERGDGSVLVLVPGSFSTGAVFDLSGGRATY